MLLFACIDIFQYLFSSLWNEIHVDGFQSVESVSRWLKRFVFKI